MAKAPIEMMMDRIEYVAVSFPEGEEPEGLHVTYEGILEIEGFKFRAYVLSDGQRVFDADDVEKFFAGMTE